MDEIERLQKEMLKRQITPKGFATDSRTIDHPGQPTASECPACEMSIIIHCDNCHIQITGCGCVLQELLAEERDRATAERLGLWTPNSNN